MPRHEFTWRTVHFVGHWIGKTSPRPSPTHLLAARTPVHEDGARDRDAPLVVHERSDGETVRHGPTGADEGYLPERTIVTRGPVDANGTPITHRGFFASEKTLTSGWQPEIVLRTGHGYHYKRFVWFSSMTTKRSDKETVGHGPTVIDEVKFPKRHRNT